MTGRLRQAAILAGLVAACGCASDPVGGLSFACDPTAADPGCGPGWRCVATTGDGYAGICRAPGDSGCEPVCAGRECGDDGCGGTCGTCPDGGECRRGACTPISCGTGECPPMVLVPAGGFFMGCNREGGDCSNVRDSHCDDDELPCHRVDVPAFEIDRFEVSVAAYRRCVEAKAATGKGCEPPEGAGPLCTYGAEGRDDHPVNCLTWKRAGEYCAWAGGGRRLCREAEWERAARGDDGRIYPWALGGADCEKAVYAGCACDSHTCPVGSRPAGAGPFGAEDLAGNVWEWVEDVYHAGFDPDGDGKVDAPTDGSAWADVGPRRVIRGGAYSWPAEHIRASNRDTWESSQWDPDTGLRCCRL